MAFYSVFTGSSALPVAAIVTVAVCICFGLTFGVTLIKSFFLVKYSASFGGPAIQSFVVHDIVRPSHSCGRCQAKHERECVGGGGGGGGCGDRGRCHFDQEQKGVVGTKKQHLRTRHMQVSQAATVTTSTPGYYNRAMFTVLLAALCITSAHSSARFQGLEMCT